MIETLKQTATGIAINREWLGDGGVPVPHHIAERRAKICEICPLNVEPNWAQRNITNPIAKTMLRWIAYKNQLGLHTSVEKDLNICKACGCDTSVKVFTPIQHIRAHTNEETLNKYHNACWVPQEMGQSKL
jgi:hypothetical protein